MSSHSTLPSTFPVKTVVLIAGYRVPHSSVSITSAFNMIPTCTVAVPPAPKLFKIGRFDKVPLQVFINNQFGTLKSDVDNHILLFEGDITGFGYVNSTTGRDFVINAEGVLNFLKDLQVQFLSGAADMVSHRLTNAGLSKFDAQVLPRQFPLSLFTHGLVGGVTKENRIKSPTDFLENVYKFISTPGNVGIINNSVIAKFYEHYCNNLIRLNRRYVRLPHFDVENSITGQEVDDNFGSFPILELIQKNAGLKFVAQLFQDGPPSSNIYDIVTYVVSQMEYEFAFFASPTMRGDKLVSSCLKPIFYDAQPPKCNIVFGSQVISMRTEEQVARIPTRIKTESRSAVLEALGLDKSPTGFGFRINWYPVSETMRYAGTSMTAPAHMDILDNEKHTGPLVYETYAPTWMELLGSTQESPDIAQTQFNSFKEQILKTMLLLKQYEGRSFHVETAFNPYYTPGFPGVVFDSLDSRISIAGHFLSVTHRISKSNASTSIDVGFSRTLEDAIDPEARIENTYKKIYDDITSSAGKMSDIYNEILGCQAVSYQELNSKLEEDRGFAAPTPRSAYNYNKRDICTAGQYAGFLGQGVIDEDGIERFQAEARVDTRGADLVGFHGYYFFERFDPKLREIVESIANEEYDSLIYNY